MKTIAALALAAAYLSAHAEDLSPSILSCSGYTDAADFVSSFSAKKPGRVVNGVGYYTPRRRVTFGGQPVLALFAYGAGVDQHGPGYGYGVVLEGTPAYGAMLVKNSPAHAWPSNYGMSDHEFIEVGCIK
ncbi:hypothetical protein [Burkholderia stagnalis]|uniref:hypothetical protein n=1 Tax=Burkholderia stagnalis TaxID=1503054 RepID=UPI000A804651|nr:hypothetical protein [Burkholderia stagnalis]